MNKQGPNGIVWLSDKLKSWPGEMALTSGDIADLLAILSDYEAALPLLEAARAAERLRYVNLWKNLPTEQVFSNDGIRDILRAAHAYRERSQPND